MSSLSCGAAGDCTAMGSYHCAQGCLHEAYPFLVGESDGVWSRGIVPRAPRGGGNQPWSGSNPWGTVWCSDQTGDSWCNSSDGVSCPAAASCHVLGEYTVAGAGHGKEPYQAAVLGETRGTWSPYGPVRWRPPYTVLDLNVTEGIACAGAGACTGLANLYGTTQGFWLGQTRLSCATRPEVVDIRNGKVVGTLTLPEPRNLQRPTPFPRCNGAAARWIACPSASSCVAIGGYITSHCRPAFLIHSLPCTGSAVAYSELHGRWSATPLQLPPGALVMRYGSLHLPPGIDAYASDPQLYDSPGPLACGASGSCTAIGDYVDAKTGSVFGDLFDEVNGKWQRAIEAPLPANATPPAQAGQEVDLTSISCATGGNCMAVGDYQVPTSDPEFGTFTLIVTETDGVWSHPTSITPQRTASFPTNDPKYSEDSLASVSCPSVGSCVAVGSSTGAPLVATETNGVWSVSEPAPPANVSTNPNRNATELSDVDCASAGNCTAIGTYTDTLGHTDGWAVTETSGVWGTGVELQLP